MITEPITASAGSDRVGSLVDHRLDLRQNRFGRALSGGHQIAGSINDNHVGAGNLSVCDEHDLVVDNCRQAQGWSTACNPNLTLMFSTLSDTAVVVATPIRCSSHASMTTGISCRLASIARTSAKEV